RKLSRRGIAKGARRIGFWSGARNIPVEHVLNDVMERISSACAPDTVGDASSLLQNAKGFAHGSGSVLEEHDAEAADDGIEEVRVERKLFGATLDKTDIRQSALDAGAFRDF